jgi:23S rRNA-intervening sequence protein
LRNATQPSAVCLAGHEAYVGDFTKLAVWKKAHDVALSVYHETLRWPRHELFGLTSQSRRAAVSIPANIAEGCGKNSDGEIVETCAKLAGLRK